MISFIQTINIDPGQIVFDLQVGVSIDESRRLTSVSAPPIKSGNEIEVVDKDAVNPLANIDNLSPSQALVTFAPSKVGNEFELILLLLHQLVAFARIYYLRNKKVSTRLHVYLRLESTNHQKIGEIFKALQICKSSTQTTSF